MSKKTAEKSTTNNKAPAKKTEVKESEKPKADAKVVEDKSAPKIPVKPKPAVRKAEAPKKKEEVKKAETPKKKEEVKKAKKEPEITLDTLDVIAVDGIGRKIMEKFKPIGIKTLEQLASTSPSNIALLTKIPVHRLMEYKTKAEKILELEFDEELLDALAAKNYTIEQAIEEQPEKLMEITKRDRDQILEFLKKVIQITMFLDAATCRNSSVKILHRKPEKRYKPPSTIGDTLDTLSVEVIEGIGPKITTMLNKGGVLTIADLVRTHPAALQRNVKLPIHKLMEYRKKAQMILRLALDGKIIDALAAKDYTIEQAIEEDPETIRRLAGRTKEQAMEFLDRAVQVTIFLDANVCRTSSVSLLRKSSKAPGVGYDIDDIRYLGKEQIFAKIYSTELDFTITKLLRDRARNKTELTRLLEDRMMGSSLHEINEVIDLLVQTELIQLEWFEGNFDVHMFLVSDFTIMRTPAHKIIKEAEKNLPSPIVAEKYLEEVAKYFFEYKPTPDDNLFIAELLRDPDIFVTLTLLRERTYPLKKFPKGMGDGVDMLTIIRKMAEAGLIQIIKDETKEEWVLLLTDIHAPQFYAEYMIENIRKDVEEKKVTPDLAERHLDLLEIHYDSYYEIYSKFFSWSE